VFVISPSIPGLHSPSPVQHFDPSDPAQVARLGDDSQFLAAVEQEMASNPGASAQARQAVRDALAHCDLAALTNAERAQIVYDAEHTIAGGPPGKEYAHVVEDIFLFSNAQGSMPPTPQLLPHQPFTLPPLLAAPTAPPAPPTQPATPAITQTPLPPAGQPVSVPVLMMEHPGLLQLLGSSTGTLPASWTQLANNDYFLTAVSNAMDSNYSRQYAAHVMRALYNCDLSHLSNAERAEILNSVKTLAQGAPTITQQDNQFNSTMQMIASYSSN
jgi:hypothetical protein